MKPVHFVDTTIRDGNMSLWASSMRTDMILSVVARWIELAFRRRRSFPAHSSKNGAGIARRSVGAVVPIAEGMPRTPARDYGPFATAFDFTPRSIAHLLWDAILAANGVREVRISDCSNTVSVWERQVVNCRRVGLKTILN